MKKWILTLLAITCLTFTVSFRAMPGSLAQAALYPTYSLGRGSVLQNGLDQILAAAPADSQVTVTVILTTQVDLSAPQPANGLPRHQSALQSLRATAGLSQKGLRALLSAHQSDGLVTRVTPLWIFNGMIVTAQPNVIRELANRPEVSRIEPEVTFHAPEISVPSAAARSAVESAAATSWNVAQVHAADMWSLGYEGQGVVVGIIDTGVDASHPALQSQYRGGTNSWYDPYGTYPSPTDAAGTSSGHGTAVMSVILGNNAYGMALGVAPKARWIAARLYDDQGAASSYTAHLDFQWLLDPDGNPATPDAPQVVSNSWSFSNVMCDLSLQLDLQRLRALGILPIFSAGNYGPNPTSGAAPATYPEAFAVGAVNSNGIAPSFSSRGPTDCGRAASATYPDVAAPGVLIRTAAPGGGYTLESGTSFAAPHAAGVLALLLSANPGMSVDEQASVLRATADDLGPAGPDNTYGWGQINALAAFQLLAPAKIPYYFYLPFFAIIP